MRVAFIVLIVKLAFNSRDLVELVDSTPSFFLFGLTIAGGQEV